MPLATPERMGNKMTKRVKFYVYVARSMPKIWMKAPMDSCSLVFIRFWARCDPRIVNGRPAAIERGRMTQVA